MSSRRPCRSTAESGLGVESLDGIGAIERQPRNAVGIDGQRPVPGVVQGILQLRRRRVPCR